MADLADVGRQVSPRFQLVNAVPVTTAVVFIGVILGSGAWSGEPSLAQLKDSVGGFGLQELAIGTFIVLSLGLVANSFQTRMVKVLEGYWAPVGPRLLFLAAGLDRHYARRYRLRVLLGSTAPIGKWQAFWLGLVPELRRVQLETQYRQWVGAKADEYPPQPPHCDAEIPDASQPDFLSLNPPIWFLPVGSE